MQRNKMEVRIQPAGLQSECLKFGKQIGGLNSYVSFTRVLGLLGYSTEAALNGCGADVSLC